MAKIIAPKPLTMQILGVTFKNGEATVTSQPLIDFFRSRHFTIIEEAAVKKATVETVVDLTPVIKSSKKKGD